MIASSVSDVGNTARVRIIYSVFKSNQNSLFWTLLRGFCFRRTDGTVCASLSIPYKSPQSEVTNEVEFKETMPIVC